MTLSKVLTTVEIAAGVLGSLVLIFIIYILHKRIRRYINHLRFGKEGLKRERIVNQWQQIEQLMAQPGEMSLKLAVMEADKLLDHVLKLMFMPGDDMGHRLEYACRKYEQLKKVWWAHKIRNQLVHESTFNLDRRKEERAVRAFKKALEVLGAL